MNSPSRTVGFPGFVFFEGPAFLFQVAPIFNHSQAIDKCTTILIGKIVNIPNKINLNSQLNIQQQPYSVYPVKTELEDQDASEQPRYNKTKRKVNNK